MQARNPRLIYCSISGYGQDGPARDEPAMDLIVQCSSGLLSITGYEGGEPARCGYSVADVSAGMFAIIGILMALRSRERTGRGQFVDVSMFDCDDLRHELLLHDLPGLERLPEADGIQLPDDRSVPRLSLEGPRFFPGRRQ